MEILLVILALILLILPSLFYKRLSAGRWLLILIITGVLFLGLIWLDASAGSIYTRGLLTIIIISNFILQYKKVRK